MAWVEKLEVERKPERGRMQPTQVVARVKIFDRLEANESPIIQIDTFGSGDRMIPGKQSQTLQFGREAATELFSLLKEVYGLR